jgi:hypothetical protein
VLDNHASLTFLCESTAGKLHVTMSLHDGHLLWCHGLYGHIHRVGWRLSHWRCDELLELEDEKDKNQFTVAAKWCEENSPEGSPASFRPCESNSIGPLEGRPFEGLRCCAH